MDIKEIFAIPMYQNNQTEMIKLNRTFVIESEDLKYKAVTEGILSKCLSYGNITICSSILNDSFNELDNCLISIMSKGENFTCKTDPIKTQNYFVQLTETMLYCYVTEPLTLRVLCGDRETIFDLLTSKLIRYSEFCEVTKLSNDTSNENLTVVFSEIEEPIFNPELYIYNTTSEWYTNISIISKYELDYLALINRSDIVNGTLIELRNDIEEEEESEFNLDWLTNAWGNIKYFFKTAFGSFLITASCYILVPIIVFQLIACIIRNCLCRVTRASS